MSTTSERFSFILTGSDEDAARASQSRKKIAQELDSCDFLDQHQKQDVEIAVGEAVTNAVKHASLKDDKEECVICEVVKASDSFGVKIANPSDDLLPLSSSPPELLEERGRGRVLIVRLVADLRQSGLKARSSYRFEPRQRKTIFFLSVRR